MIEVTLSHLVEFLEKAIPATSDFRRKINSFLESLREHLDRSYPHFLIVDDSDPWSWLVIWIGTYNYQQKVIVIEIVAYLDGSVVRFLRRPSPLKFIDSQPEITCLSPDEKLTYFFLSNRHTLPFQQLVKPPRPHPCYQRIISLQEKIVAHLRDSRFKHCFEMLVSLIPQTLEYSQNTPELNLFQDELVILLDDFLDYLENNRPYFHHSILLSWKVSLVAKIRLLVIQVDPTRQHRNFFRRKFLTVNLLFFEAFFEIEISMNWLAEFCRYYRTNLTTATPDSLVFLESLLEDVETTYLSSRVTSDQLKRWRQAVGNFWRQQGGYYLDITTTS